MPDFALSYLSFEISDYEPPDEETALLGYRRGVVRPQIPDFYRYYSRLQDS